MSIDEAGLTKILEKTLGISRGFSLREVMLIALIIVSGAGSWYASQSRIDKLEVFTKNFSEQFSNQLDKFGTRTRENAQAINAHLQWEMEHEIAQKQAIIDKLTLKANQ